MKIKVTFFGILKLSTGMPSIEVELGDGVTLGELLREVGRRVGEKLPEWAWNPRDQTFKPGVFISLDNEQVKDLSRSLHDGSEVLLTYPMGGG